MKAKETLETALELVTGDRAEQYGDMHQCHQLIADLWNTYVRGKEIEAHDVAIMMALLKIARMQTGSRTPDNYTDLAGYAAVAAQLARSEPIDLPGPTVEQQAFLNDLQIANGDAR
jgi:hypothetical protein